MDQAVLAAHLAEFAEKGNSGRQPVLTCEPVESVAELCQALAVFKLAKKDNFVQTPAHGGSSVLLAKEDIGLDKALLWQAPAMRGAPVQHVGARADHGIRKLNTLPFHVP